MADTDTTNTDTTNTDTAGALRRATRKTPAGAPRTPHPILLVPGHWLGGWAWDEVVASLRERGHDATAVTLPGLEEGGAGPGGVRFASHVAAVLGAFDAGGPAAVLVAHSGSGAVATAALDAAPERFVRVVYVESGPVADGAVPRPDLEADAADVPLPPFPELAEGGASLEGLDAGMLERFRRRAVPHPAAVLREPVRLGDPARNAIPATVVCSSFPAATVRDLAASGQQMFAALAALREVDYVDLPTGHWPMWTRPEELAGVIAASCPAP